MCKGPYDDDIDDTHNDDNDDDMAFGRHDDMVAATRGSAATDQGHPKAALRQNRGHPGRQRCGDAEATSCAALRTKPAEPKALACDVKRH